MNNFGLEIIAGGQAGPVCYLNIGTDIDLDVESVAVDLEVEPLDVALDAEAVDIDLERAPCDDQADVQAIDIDLQVPSCE